MPAAHSSSQHENLLNLTPTRAEATLLEFCRAHGLPSYRASQVLRRLWTNPAPDFESMTELPKTLRRDLAGTFELPRPALAARQRSMDGTEKFLFMLSDGQAI